jgi:hypothetical protein
MSQRASKQLIGGKRYFDKNEIPKCIRIGDDGYDHDRYLWTYTQDEANVIRHEVIMGQARNKADSEDLSLYNTSSLTATAEKATPPKNDTPPPSAKQTSSRKRVNDETPKYKNNPETPGAKQPRNTKATAGKMTNNATTPAATRRKKAICDATPAAFAGFASDDNPVTATKPTTRDAISAACATATETTTRDAITAAQKTLRDSTRVDNNTSNKKAKREDDYHSSSDHRNEGPSSRYRCHDEDDYHGGSDHRDEGPSSRYRYHDEDDYHGGSDRRDSRYRYHHEDEYRSSDHRDSRYRFYAPAYQSWNHYQAEDRPPPVPHHRSVPTAPHHNHPVPTLYQHAYPTPPFVVQNCPQDWLPGSKHNVVEHRWGETIDHIVETASLITENKRLRDMLYQEDFKKEMKKQMGLHRF